MKRHLEYNDDKSYKFWKIETAKNTFTVIYGKVGTKGQSKTKTFESVEKAIIEAEKLIKQKLKKGYLDKKVETNSQKELAIKKEVQISNIDYYKELIKFDKTYGGETYTECFFMVDDEDDFFESWLHEVSIEKIKEYSESLQIFASADGTGARYAFWYTNGNNDPNKAPIIFYGSEGEIHIVASTIKDLIKMLSFGIEFSDGSFYRGCYDDDYEEDEDCFTEHLDVYPNFLTFRTWMKESLNIKPVKKWKKEGENKEIKKLVKEAKRKYKKDFDAWQYQFYPNPKDEEKEYANKQQVIYDKIKAELLSKIEKKPTADLYYQLSENETKTYGISGEIDNNKREKYLEKAFEIDPKNEIVLKNLVKFYEYPKSIAYYNKLIEISDTPEKYYSDIARVYENNKKLTEAIDYYVKAILTGNSGWDGAYQEYIINICKDLKNKDALKILEDTLQKGPNQDTHKVLYKQYFKKKIYQKALEHALQYIELSDEQSHNFISLAEKFFKRELYSEAATIFIKTLKDKKDPWLDKLQVTNYIGLCYLRLDNETDNALKYFKKAYKADKDEVAVHQNIYTCGTQYFQQDALNKALDCFEFCITNFEYEKGETYNFLGVICDKQDKNKDALVHFEKALTIEPDNELYTENLTYIKNKMGNNKGF